jgi:Zn-dependent peptidase ImmA (M78 family)
MAWMQTKSIEQAKRDQRVRQAAEAAADVVEHLSILEPPVDPFWVAESECPLLHVVPDHFEDAFDGRLVFQDGSFFCYLNTKYNTFDTSHAPRTRFSLAHELGHYFIDSHHHFIRSGGRSHPSIWSRNSAASRVIIEQQANQFAADLLMPPRLFRPLANSVEPSMDALQELAGLFDTSLPSTAVQLVKNTDQCVAAFGIRAGKTDMRCVGQGLIDLGLYPRPKELPKSSAAANAWEACCRGCGEFEVGTSWVGDWFQSFKGFDSVPLVEHYARIQQVDELLVLVVLPEEELAAE